MDQDSGKTSRLLQENIRRSISAETLLSLLLGEKILKQDEVADIQTVPIEGRVDFLFSKVQMKGNDAVKVLIDILNAKFPQSSGRTSRKLDQYKLGDGKTNDSRDVWDAMFNGTIDQQFSTIDRTSTETAEERLLELRNKDNRNVLICHQNTNSIQNKIEDLIELKKSLSAQILFITETKIDNSYPDEQFKIEGYRIFRPPKAIGKEHLLQVEREDLDLDRLQLGLLGDLDLDRLQPESTE
eukprot:gene8486-14482_t